MKRVLNRFIVVGISLVVITFTQCSGTKGKYFQSIPPFKIIKATYENINGDSPWRNTLVINIEIDNPDVVLDSIYFKGNKIALHAKRGEHKGYFTGSKLASFSKEMILHKDPKKEFGNPVPVVLSKLSFDLKGNEAVISYQYRTERSHFKISELKEIQ